MMKPLNNFWHGNHVYTKMITHNDFITVMKTCAWKTLSYLPRYNRTARAQHRMKRSENKRSRRARRSEGRLEERTMEKLV